ncbi:uncharacterized protein [Lolium perenne]|uniref:uncharacterized protein isoform X2 n=1 Tax=Lolium perenne TaxID=4522 RepID=UPI003A99634C
MTITCSYKNPFMVEFLFKVTRLVNNLFMPSIRSWLNFCSRYVTVCANNPFMARIHSRLNFCSSPRIFEIKKVWVDQRTFTLSINQGGWIHPCVMDCFGMLTTTEQNHRRREGLLEKNDMLIHVVIKEDTAILMDPNLNYSDPGLKMVLSFDNVGFR